MSARGASAYRMVPLLRSFCGELDIPIDVVGGAGGGALLATYFSAEGLAGLDKAIAEGQSLTLFALGALLCSAMMRTKVDWDLAAARIEDLEIRCVPLAAVLDAEHAPGTHAVVAGTVGEGVGVGVGAPWLRLPRLLRRRRYADSAATLVVPARTIREHGADLVFAVNCVPGPTAGNPLSHYLNGRLPPFRLGDVLSNFTPFGSVFDAWLEAAFVTQQASRVVEEDAHVYLEPQSSSLSPLERVMFYDAARLVEETEEELAQERGIARDVARCAAVWERFRRSPRL